MSDTEHTDVPASEPQRDKLFRSPHSSEHMSELAKRPRKPRMAKATVARAQAALAMLQGAGRLRAPVAKVLDVWREEVLEELGAESTLLQRALIDVIVLERYVLQTVDNYLLATGNIVNKGKRALHAIVMHRQAIADSYTAHMAELAPSGGRETFSSAFAAIIAGDANDRQRETVVAGFVAVSREMESELRPDSPPSSAEVAAPLPSQLAAPASESSPPERGPALPPAPWPPAHFRTFRVLEGGAPKSIDADIIPSPTPKGDDPQ